MQKTWVWSLGWEDPLEKGKATHSSVLEWRILWTTVHGVAKRQTRLSDFDFTSLPLCVAGVLRAQMPGERVETASRLQPTLRSCIVSLPLWSQAHLCSRGGNRPHYSVRREASLCVLWEHSLESESVKVLHAQSCPTLCDPMDNSPPGSSLHGILQARIVEWVAIPFPRGSFLSLEINYLR